MGLFRSWYEHEITSGKKQADILREINAACGTKYQSNWISQMLNTVQGMSRSPLVVRRYMMTAVLRSCLNKYGITDETEINAIIDSLI